MTYDVLSPGVARLWDIEPDWRNSFSVTRSFKTRIATSRDNTEQRSSLRATPRFSISYRSVVSGPALTAANRFLRAWQNKPTIIPDFARWARLTAAAASGSSTFTISPVPVWIAEGQPLILCGAVKELVRVDHVTGSSVTLVAPLANDWPSGAIIRPSFHGLLDGKISTSRVTKAAAEIDVNLSAYPGGEPPRELGTPWAMLNGREIFTPQPDHASPPSLAHLWPVESVDYAVGRTAQFRPVTSQQQSFEAEYTGLGVGQAAEIEQFFDRMKGRRTAFFFPSEENDIPLASTAVSGSSAFLTPGTDLANDLAGIDYGAFEQAIRVCLTDGTKLYRRVTSVVASGGNTLVSVDVPWPVDLTTANAARIGWMSLSRFATDDMTTVWVTPQSAKVRLTFQSVRGAQSFRFLRLTFNSTNGGSHLNIYEAEIAAYPGGPSLVRYKPVTSDVGATGSGLEVDNINDFDVYQWEPSSLPASATFDMGLGAAFPPVELRIIIYAAFTSPHDFSFSGSNDGTTFYPINAWHDVAAWGGSQSFSATEGAP